MAASPSGRTRARKAHVSDTSSFRDPKRVESEIELD
jgi:hypothetical protein